MTRYISFQRGLICIWIMAIGVTGCRFDNRRSNSLDVEPDKGEGNAGSGLDDERSVKPDVVPENGGGGGSGETRLNTLTGTVRDLVTAVPLEGMRVVALSNEDLSELGIEATTGYDGGFALEGIIDKEICVKVMGTEGEDARIDACHCNIPTDQADRVFTSTQLAVAEAISGMLCGDCAEPTTTVSGGVYYKNEAGEEIPVDCATVESVETTDQTHLYYFRDGLPNTEPTQTDITGRFIITYPPEGRIYLSAFVNGEKIGSVSTLTCAAKDSTGGMYSNNIVRIYTNKTTDPSPDCM